MKSITKLRIAGAAAAGLALSAIGLGGVASTASIDGFKWALNGKQYDPDYVDRYPTIDTTERWAIRNLTAAAHLVHLHHTDWYMLDHEDHGLMSQFEVVGA